MATQAKDYPHLTPAPPTREKLYYCDLCHRSEADDIIMAPIIPGTVTTGKDLIPMYFDARDGIVVCRDCAESGAYLEGID
jgi:hypothetical protein